MEDALVAFVQTGKLSFTSLAQSIIADLIRIQVQNSVTKPLAQMTSGLNLSGMFSSASNFASSLFKASGGPVTNNQPYIVGEQGPGMVYPKRVRLYHAERFATAERRVHRHAGAAGKRDFPN